MKNRLFNLLLVTAGSLVFVQCSHSPPPVKDATGTGIALHDSEAVVVEEAPEVLLPNIELTDNGLLRIGSVGAPLHMIMFTEHHCRYCRDFFVSYLPDLITNYIKTDNLYLEIGMFPLEKYPNSAMSAKGAICAAQQGQGYAMHNLLFERNNKHRTSIMAYAKKLELDIEALTTCLDDEATTNLLNGQIATAKAMEVELVPTFFFNGKKVVGLPYPQDLRALIEKALN